MAGAAGPHGAPLEAHTLRWNLTEPLPFGDSAFDDVYSEHALEHLPPRDVVGFLAEAWRVLRAGGTLRLSTPDLAKFQVKHVSVECDVRIWWHVQAQKLYLAALDKQPVQDVQASTETSDMATDVQRRQSAD